MAEGVNIGFQKWNFATNRWDKAIYTNFRVRGTQNKLPYISFDYKGAYGMLENTGWLAGMPARSEQPMPPPNRGPFPWHGG